MIVKSNQMQDELRPNMRGGDGTAVCRSLFGKALPAHCRLVSTITLDKGSSIGQHTHTGECEMFYILSGEVLYNYNGNDIILTKGDATITYDGEAHGVTGLSEEPAVLMAVIVLS